MTNKPPFNGERVRLGDVCEIISGSTPKSSIQDYWEGDIKWITPAEIDENSHYILDTKRHLTSKGFDSANLHMMPRGTVLLTTRAPIGKVAITGAEMCCNQGFKNLICTDRLNNEFLYRYLKSHTKELNSLGKGATFKELSKKTISDYEITLPPLKSQLEVVDKLAAVETLVAYASDSIKKLDQLIKSRFVEMFENKPYNEYELGERHKTTSGGTPSKKHPEYYEDGSIPWLTSGEVNKGVINQPSNFITEIGLRNSSAKSIPANTVVVAMYGATAGQVGIVNYETTTNQAVCAVLNDANTNATFLRYALSSKKSWMLDQSNGGAQPNISQSIIKKIRLPDVPIDEQQEFADFVAQVDKSQFVVQQQIDKLQTLYDSLAQEYFG